MSKFLELWSETKEGDIQSVILNTQYIIYVRETRQGTVIETTRGNVWVTESPEHIARMIKGEEIRPIVKPTRNRRKK